MKLEKIELTGRQIKQVTHNLEILKQRLIGYYELRKFDTLSLNKIIKEIEEYFEMVHDMAEYDSMVNISTKRLKADFDLYIKNRAL